MSRVEADDLYGCAAPVRSHDAEADAKMRAAAQAILDAHVLLSGTLLCFGCGQYGPCPQRQTALIIMSRHHWLPVRTPGATRPVLVGMKRVC